MMKRAFSKRLLTNPDVAGILDFYQKWLGIDDAEIPGITDKLYKYLDRLEPIFKDLRKGGLQDTEIISMVMGVILQGMVTMTLIVALEQTSTDDFLESIPIQNMTMN